MRLFPLVVLLAACPMPKDEDSGDADTDTDTDTDADTDTHADTADSGDSGRSPLITAVQGVCALGECVWTVEADADLGGVQLSVVETGAPERVEGCTGEVASGGLACGVWSEFHNDFELVDDNNDGRGGDTKSIALDLVADYRDQAQNETSLFDLASAGTSEQTTVLWVVTGVDGGYADCATYGHDPDYFGSYCSNVW